MSSYNQILGLRDPMIRTDFDPFYTYRQVASGVLEKFWGTKFSQEAASSRATVILGRTKFEDLFK